MLERAAAWLAPIGLLAIWELAVRTGLLDARFFPAPSAIARTLLTLSLEPPQSGSLFVHTAVSLSRAAVGFLIGAVPAVLLGVIMGLVPLARAALQPLVAALFPRPR